MTASSNDRRTITSHQRHADLPGRQKYGSVERTRRRAGIVPRLPRHGVAAMRQQMRADRVVQALSQFGHCRVAVDGLRCRLEVTMVKENSTRRGMLT